MSGASAKCPPQFMSHLEAAQGGLLAKLRDGDMIRLDSESGELSCAEDLSARPLVEADIKKFGAGFRGAIYSAC